MYTKRTQFSQATGRDVKAAWDVTKRWGCVHRVWVGPPRGGWQCGRVGMQEFQTEETAWVRRGGRKARGLGGGLVEEAIYR